MGGTSSQPRDISFSNPSNIRISEDVSHRISNQFKAEFEENKQKQQQQQQHQQQQQQQQEQQSYSRQEFVQENAEQHTHQPSQHQAQSSLNSDCNSIYDKAQIKKAKATEKLYRQKIENLNALNEKLLNDTKEEFKRTVSSVSEKFSHHIGQPICDEQCYKVIDCYKTHKGETLKCSQVVNEFTQCVRQERHRLMNTSAM